MHTAALSGSIESVAAIDDDDDTVAVPRPAGLAWTQLPRIAQAYVLVVAVAGAYALAQAFPRTFPEPFLFLGLLIAACLTSIWKVTLPLPLTSGSTLSVSYAADLMALLLLGPKPAVVDRRRRRAGAVHDQGEGAVPDLPHALQHGRQRRSR